MMDHGIKMKLKPEGEAHEGKCRVKPRDDTLLCYTKILPIEKKMNRKSVKWRKKLSELLLKYADLFSYPKKGEKAHGRGLLICSRRNPPSTGSTRSART